MNRLLRLGCVEVSCTCEELFLRELFSVASSLTPISCGGRFIEICSAAMVEVSGSIGDFLRELFSAASSLTSSWGGRFVDLFSPACCDCRGGGLGDLFCPVASVGTQCCGGPLADRFCPVCSGGSSPNGCAACKTSAGVLRNLCSASLSSCASFSL